MQIYLAFSTHVKHKRPLQNSISVVFLSHWLLSTTSFQPKRNLHSRSSLFLRHHNLYKHYASVFFSLKNRLSARFCASWTAETYLLTILNVFEFNSRVRIYACINFLNILIFRRWKEIVYNRFFMHTIFLFLLCSALECRKIEEKRIIRYSLLLA